MKRALQIILLVVVLTGWIFLVALCRADDPQHIRDLREWPANGGIVVSNWNTGGFTFDWHVEQVRSGNRFLPTTKLHPYREALIVSIGAGLRPDNESFLRDGKLPLSIRTDNIANVVVSQPRLPLAPESIPNSLVVWTIKNGVLDDQAIADAFGRADLWGKLGRDWASVGMVTDLQRRFPDAPMILLGENNESNVDKIGFYGSNGNWFPALETRSIRVRDYAASGKSFAQFRREFNTRQDAQYNALYAGFDDALTAWKGRLFSESYKIPAFRNDWDTDASDQYSPQFGHTDAGGGGLYVSSSVLPDFTSTEWFQIYLASPVHLKAESLNPKHIREVFLNLSPGGCFTGYQQGRHEVINQERYAAHIQWLLWSMKGDGNPVHLRYYVDNSFKISDSSGVPILNAQGKPQSTLTLPDTPLCRTDAARQIVTDAGYPELATATESMPIEAVNQAVNTILDHPVLRKFWLEGKPVQTGTHPANEYRLKLYDVPKVFPQPGDRDDGFRLLECDLNTPRDEWLIPPGPRNNGRWNADAQIKVWGTATELNGEYLVHLESQCKLTGACKVTIPNVGTFEMPVPQPNLYRRVRRAEWVVETIE